MELTGTAWTLVVLFLFSAYGWGRLCRFFCDSRIFRFHSLSAVMGFSLLNFIGGLLNLLGWAKAESFFGLLFGGVALAGADLVKVKPWRAYRPRGERAEMQPETPRGARLKSTLPLLLALIAGSVACALLVPTSVFNYHDDFHTYAARVARMVQTGSVGGNAFDGIGLDSLGSQSFFQGFFLPGLDIGLLNGFDAVACFTLCLLLIAELSLRWRLPWFVGALGVICVTVINPQHVNISALYSGSLLITALVISGAMLARSSRTMRWNKACRLDLTLAFLASLLVTLKTTLAFFALLYLACLYGILFAKARSRLAVLKSALVTGTLLALLILPWLFVHSPVLVKAARLGRELKDAATLTTKYPSIAAHDIPRLFSFRQSLYRDSPASFLALVCVCVGVAAVCFFGWLRRPSDKRTTESLAFAALGIAVPTVYLLNGHLFTAEWAIRYSCPVLLGCFPVACFGLLRLGDAQSAGYRRRVALSAGLIALAILMFAGTFCSRVQRAFQHRTLLAFPLDQDFADCSTHIVSQNEMLYCRFLQSIMEADSSALIWIVAPFQLDFSRNRLLSVSEPGLINPALHFPAGADLDSLGNYLHKAGIRYVLIETNGTAVKTVAILELYLGAQDSVYRKLGDYGIYFRKSLLALAERGRVLYSDGRMLLFELDGTAKRHSPPASRIGE